MSAAAKKPKRNVPVDQERITMQQRPDGALRVGYLALGAIIERLRDTTTSVPYQREWIVRDLEPIATMLYDAAVVYEARS